MRRFGTREGIAISLFPFLAVLLCTMGALLVLLVLFGNSINQQEENLAVEQSELMKSELRGRSDSLSWRLEQLSDMRSKTNDELESLRLQLAGIEENTRDLSADLHGLHEFQENLVKTDSFESPTDDELRALEQKLASARESLDEARREKDSKPPAYAVVPYEGPSGTHRRPLFIECCLDGVFLQPEGIRLNPNDFEGPPGPGNPLASGLRAAREYLARQAVSQNDPGLRPYPLLIVRPSGVMAYYAARDAISSWGSDFGYQLIEEDWRLAFPEKDLALRDAELQAINEARDRLKWLSQTRSNIRRRSPAKQQYRAASVRGGAVAVGGPSVLGDQSQWDWSKQQAKAGKSSGGNATQGQGVSRDGLVSANTTVGRPMNAGESFGGSHFGKGQSETGIGHGNGGSTAKGSLTGVADPSMQSGIGGGQPGLSRFGNGEGKEIASAVDERPGGGHGKSEEGSNGSQRGSGEGSPGGTGMASSGSQQAAGSEGGASGMSSAQSQAIAGGAPGGSAGGGIPMPLGLQAGTHAGSPAMSSSTSGEQSGASGSLSGARGSDWASFATSDRYIPLTRPIQIECAAEELRLFDDTGSRVVYRIPVVGPTIQSIDSLVIAIRQRVESWGIAGDRLYWKPELVLTETEDGLGRREDVQALLTNSGIETRQKQASDAIRRLPPAKPRQQRIRRTAQLETAVTSPEVGL